MAETEVRLPGGKAFDRIDITIKNPKNDHYVCLIEAKFLFCNECYQRGRGHPYLTNVLKDIEKRRHHRLPQQEIVLAAEYARGSPKTGQSGSPENRPVVDHHPGR